MSKMITIKNNTTIEVDITEEEYDVYFALLNSRDNDYNLHLYTDNDEQIAKFVDKTGKNTVILVKN